MKGNDEMDGYTAASEGMLPTLRAQLRDVLSVRDEKILVAPDRVVSFSGQLLRDAESAYTALRERFKALGYTPHLEQQGENQVVIAQQGVASTRALQARVNVALFVATVLATLFVGAFNEVAQVIIQPGMGELEAMRAMFAAVVRYPALLLTGVPFALTLMSILLTHEMGHYLVGRRYNAPVSLPYFIPLPVPGSFGTMGAVIVQRAPFEDRKSLFDIGIAGPLAGLIVALPLLVYGLMTSQVGPITLPALLEGNSILYLAIKYLVFGRILPSHGIDVMLNPIAWAAWGGLFITSFNLLPIGQLDGGHTLYALLGRRAWNVAMSMVVLLVVLSLLYPGWLFLAFLALIVGVRHPAPLNDLTPLDLKRKLLGIGIVILFILIFTPIPFTALN